MNRQTLRPWERIRNSADFTRCFKAGKRKRLPGLTVVYAPNSRGYRRIGLSVGRRIGPAVKRNRVKRILREIFRRNKTIFPDGYDFVFVPREDFLEIKWEEHIRHLRDAFYSS
ncbi:Ribonuclease P protein component [Dissulfuribacter thermophilus]|uniref:Ribonuclease P protein component n=1 Tax=Dissulfuribacter thermophilus TaxID=1156395 RepID=A0A1B9F8V2_9BACT|nr:ribonuclease P protein component [Dissulfuribacter thermophilus]OCC16378.1 Ribonuclease P protein component [Dissulfuribacter thermophilus]